MTRQRVPNLELASDTARANLLTNGGFEIWQRGNGPFTASGAYSADRWIVFPNGSDTLSVSKDTTHTDNTGACAACTFTLGTGGGNTTLYQIVPLLEVNLAQKTCSVSIRVRCSTANAVRIGFYNGASYTNSGFHSGGGTYETLTATGTITSGSQVFTSVFFAAACTAYIDNAMLVVGSVAADYVPLHPADDLARCLRYYQRLSATGAQQEFGGGQVYQSTNAVALVPTPVQLAAFPTLTVSAVTDLQMSTQIYGGAVCSSISMRSWAKNQVGLNIAVGSGLVAGSASNLMSVNANAWLALEINP